MNYRTIRHSSISLVAATWLALAGCSDSDIIGTSEEPTVDPHAITFYFPIEPGYTSTLEVRDSDGRTSAMTFKVGAEVPFGSSSAVQWFHQAGSGFDTSYVRVSGTAIFLYESSSSLPERILQGPLVQGSSWTRYPAVDAPLDTTSIVTGETDLGDVIGKGDDNGGGSSAAKSFPTTGSNEMRVERVETIQLSNGSSFAGCAKVTNQLSDGSENQYWFAPGYGLVKYVIGATENYPLGRQTGELVSFIK